MLDIINVYIDNKGNYNWEDLKSYSIELKSMLNELDPIFQNNELDKYSSNILIKYTGIKKELSHISEITGVSINKLLILNTFYDTQKLLCGCTTYIGNSPSGPLHMHNLDWETAKKTLEKYLKVIRFENACGNSIIYSIGWPGFIGVFWGMRLGGYSVSLNAVWSEIPSTTQYPLNLFIRDTLMKHEDYNGALKYLKSSEISSDCILSVCGIYENEFALIERTPIHSSIIKDEKYCCATNHYNKLKMGSNKEGYVETGEEVFGLNSKERLNAIISNLNSKTPSDVNECFELASKEPTENELTLLKIVFDNSDKELLIQLPNSNKRYVFKENLNSRK